MVLSMAAMLPILSHQEIVYNMAMPSVRIRSKSLWCHPFAEQNRGMEVGLLLSIDRRESAEEAMQTVALAKQYHGRGVSGLDLSGNPQLGSWNMYRPALDAARKAGLCVSLHAGEVSKHLVQRSRIQDTLKFV